MDGNLPRDFKTDGFSEHQTSGTAAVFPMPMPAPTPVDTTGGYNSGGFEVSGSRSLDPQLSSAIPAYVERPKFDINDPKFDEPQPSEPPPAFHEYSPEFRENDEGDITSHDKHLNEDGEALYRFLLSRASDPPSFYLYCRGSHTETRWRTVTQYRNGQSYTTQESYQETITDFDFRIDISQYICHESLGAPIYILGDRHATYRGDPHKQVDNTPLPLGEDDDVEKGPTGIPLRRDATDDEITATKARWTLRRDAGVPPWVLLPGEQPGTEASLDSAETRHNLQFATNTRMQGIEDGILNPPPKNLRTSADEYCASKKHLKEFTFRKEVYGWNFGALRAAIDEVIRQNYTHSNVTVKFVCARKEISIRPDNRLSRTLSKTWAYVLLWIFLVYPLIIWPWKRFSKHGGGEWRVAGSAFGLTKWVHLEDSLPGETVQAYLGRHSGPVNPIGRPPMMKMTPRGISELAGLREGEWFGMWAETIATFVRQRRINSSEIVRQPMGPHYSGAFAHLDGFYPNA